MRTVSNNELQSVADSVELTARRLPQPLPVNAMRISVLWREDVELNAVHVKQRCVTVGVIRSFLVDD